MKRIVYIHGRDYKPRQDILMNNWTQSIITGLRRDYTQNEVEMFEKMPIDMAYYGDISNVFLDEHCDAYDEASDITDRTLSIKKLSNYDTPGFSKESYKKLVFGNTFLETIADMSSKPMHLLGFGDAVIGLFAPDIRHYWNQDSAFGSQVREPLTQILSEALEAEDEVLLISHSLGTMIAYDVLWKFSHYSEYKHIRDKKLARWLTLGSPLGDENVKSKLKGAKAKGQRKYPQNISKWFNVAAHGDFVAHDEVIEDDFKEMKTSLKDIRNYNLSLRNGISDPHHSAGYLISPEVIEVIMSFMNS